MGAVVRVGAVGVALMAIVCGGALADDQTAKPDEVYRIKQDRPTTGTNISREIISATKVPLNRRYEDLTDEQKRVVRSQFDNLNPDDEPPYPANGLEPVFRLVQKAVQKLHVRDELTVVALVDANGEATGVQVLRGTDQELIRAVATVLMTTKYKPALCAGKPCAMGYPFRIAAKFDL
jgi:hypothetical protein